MKRICFLILSAFFLLHSIFLLKAVDLKTLPKMLGSNNAGIEYYFSVPPCSIDDTSGFVNHIKIFVTAPTKTLVTVEVSARGYNKSQYTTPNDIIEFDLNPTHGQPYIKGNSDPNVPEQVFPGTAIHMYSNQPFVSYTCVEYHWKSECWLNIPVSTLGWEYIVTTSEIDPIFRTNGNNKFPCIATITSPYDDNKVRFTLGGNNLTKTAGGMKPGDTKEWTLFRGDVLAISGDPDMSDLTGSRIISTKPIAVVTGNMCADVPVGNKYCNYTAEMEFPDYTWGMDCLVGKIPNRKYSSLVKVVAKEPNTKLYRDGKQIGSIPTSGGTLEYGYKVMRMTADSLPSSVHFSGDKPINVTLFNTGMLEDSNSTYVNYPFSMTTSPVQQFQKSILFYTPQLSDSSNFKNNYINLIYETDEFGLCSDSMWFAGPVHGGQLNWEQLNKKFSGVDELFQGDVNGKKYALKLIPIKENGVYAIISYKPFAAYSFGFSDSCSYGMLTAGALADLSKPDTIPPYPTWIEDCDGSVNNGVVTDMPDDASIRSNLAMILMQSDYSYNYTFNYDAFVPGDTRTTHWTLKTIDPQKDARAIITFSDRRGNDTTIEIDYHASILTIHPNYLDFGNFKLGETKSDEFCIVNLSTTSSDTLKDLKLKYGNQGFTMNLNEPLPIILNPGDSVCFQISFTASSVGLFQDSIGFGNGICFNYKALLVAKAAKVQIFVDDVSFNYLKVGNKWTKDFHITNEGSINLTITGYTGPYNSCFIINVPFVDQQNPIIVPIGQTLTYQIDFAPTIAGTFRDSITFISDADTNRKNYCLITGYAVTAVEENNPDNGNILSIYPNLASDNIFIQLNYFGMGNAECCISDLNGRIVDSFVLHNNYIDGFSENKYDVSKLSDGIYLLQVIIDGKSFTKKFTVEH